MPKISAERRLAQLLQAENDQVLRKGINDFLAEVGLAFVSALLEREVLQRCGAKYERSTERQAVRWGSQAGSVRIDGELVPVDKPRIRNESGELPLETYTALQKRDALDTPVLAAVLSGVSTRNYARLIEKPLRRRGVSKSSVSRTIIAATKPDVEAFLKRRLEQHPVFAIIIDGVHIAGRQMHVAIGLTESGRKIILGTRLGGTENSHVCRDLINDMIDRGLTVPEKCLFVIDGSKALARAITDVFGDRAVIQRCQEHKIRNVLAYLPRRQHEHFRQLLQAAFCEYSLPQALERLAAAKAEIGRYSQDAANKLVEGQLETLTLQRLGLRGKLFTTLRTTNVIESCFSAARRRMRNVTRYRDDQQMYRWVVKGLTCAEQSFHILPGHRQIAAFRKKLVAFDRTKGIS
jgi:putative transposase